jgi:hypothetical protein
MALEVLEGIKKLGGYDVVVMDELREKYPEKFNPSGAMDWKWFEAEIRPKNFVYLRKDKNSISFTIQNGPIREVGENGCQIDALVHAYREILIGLNEKFPCDENIKQIDLLNEVIELSDKRKRDRTARGVEGFNKE